MSTNRTSYETLDDVIRGMNRLSNEIKKARREFSTDPKRLQELYVNSFSPRMAELRVIASELEDKAEKNGKEQLRIAERSMMAAAANYTEGLTYNHPRPTTPSPDHSPKLSTKNIFSPKRPPSPDTPPLNIKRANKKN